MTFRTDCAPIVAIFRDIWILEAQLKEPLIGVPKDRWVDLENKSAQKWYVHAGLTL
jgi:hypothetical protein